MRPDDMVTYDVWVVPDDDACWWDRDDPDHEVTTDRAVMASCPGMILEERMYSEWDENDGWEWMGNGFGVLVIERGLIGPPVRLRGSVDISPDFSVR